MKVFVTGGTGFVGGRAVRRLRELGCELAHGDVTDKASVLEGMSGCGWAVHLAGLYSLWEPDKGVYRRVNVGGTRNVMEAALEAGVSKVVHVSTHRVWGKPDPGASPILGQARS